MKISYEVSNNSYFWPKTVALFLRPCLSISPIVLFGISFNFTFFDKISRGRKIFIATKLFFLNSLLYFFIWRESFRSNGFYLNIHRTLVFPIAKEFQPNIVLVSAGFDAAAGHSPQLGGYQVTPQCK